MTSIPAVLEVIEDFGEISGYKSSILLLNTIERVDPAGEVNQFNVVENFSYLLIFPTSEQIVQVNYKHLMETINASIIDG